MTQQAQHEVTLGDVLRLALPFGTILTGGGGQPGRIINWLVLLTDWQELSSQLLPADLVILPPRQQEQTDEQDLATYFEQLIELLVAGLVLFRPVSESLIQQAIELDLPLFIVPEANTVREVQHLVTALLVDRQTQMTERGLELYRRLAEISREGKGLEAISEMMATATGKLVVVQDKRLDVQAFAVPAGLEIDRATMADVLAQREHLPPLLRNRKAAAKARQSYWQQLLPIENMGRLVSPIISGDRARGYVSVIGPAGELNPFDRLTVEHGAAACALEMAKAKAISEVEKALRGNFLEGLLAGTLPHKEIERLRARLDHDTQSPHIVLTFSWANTPPPPLRHLETVLNWVVSSHNRPALVHKYADDHVCVFQVLKEGEGLETAQELDRRLREQLQLEYPQSRLVSGLSGPAQTLGQWPQIHQQALQAMQLGRRLHLNQLVEFNSLGVYRLLTQIETHSAVTEFVGRMLQPLADYDQRHQSSLIQTIDAFFTHHGNISQTADSLFIHRNTLLYRLERIQELTGQDLERADMRLALHLSLKFWQLRK